MALRIFAAGVVAFVFTAVAFYLGVFHGYVFTIFWWDNVQHFFGGALAGCIGAWCAAVAGYRSRITSYIAGALILGVIVEVLEYYAGFQRSLFMSYPLDTLKDVVVDIVGSYGAALFVKRYL